MGTNWPEFYHYEVKCKLVSGRIVNQVRIYKGVDSVTLFIKPERLTKSDFEYVVNSTIKSIENSSKTSLRYNAGKAALKR